MNQDVGVLLVFFNKVDTLKEVFEAVRQAKPKKLFLAQDGVRLGNDTDPLKINACREVVENIDWDCEVYRNYSEVNLTCDPRVYTAISWAFDYVDKLIIIEDDSVPNQSFFRFMDEMLQRYESDDRIHMISGIERFGENKFCKDSYYFSTINAGCAWATWKRIWKDIERWSDCTFVNDPEDVKAIDHYVKSCFPFCFHDFIEKGNRNQLINKQINGITSWEYAVATAMILANRVCITPRVNLITNIGLVEEATHSGDTLHTLPRKVRSLFFMETKELEFPLKHPNYIIRDSRYEEVYEKRFCFNRWDFLQMRIEHIWLLILHGKWDLIGDMIRKKLNRK